MFHDLSLLTQLLSSHQATISRPKLVSNDTGCCYIILRVTLVLFVSYIVGLGLGMIIEKRKNVKKNFK